MARKITPRAPQGKSRAGKDAARDDLAVLAPDITLTIDGRKVTVREYRFMEGLRMRTVMAPLIECLAQATAPGVTLPIDQVNAAFGEYPEIVAHLMAVSCDQDMEWVGNLPRRAGDALFSAWWQVNKDFFIQSVVKVVGIAMARRA